VPPPPPPPPAIARYCTEYVGGKVTANETVSVVLAIKFILSFTENTTLAAD
jgi:hypothetical protein